MPNTDDMSSWEHIWTYNDILEQVQSAKYLGITITDNLDYGQHISEISSTPTKNVGLFSAYLSHAS